MSQPSVVSGPPLSAEPSLGALTIPGYLKEITERFGAREALAIHTSTESAHWTYNTLRERSLRIARALVAVGVGKDTRVGVLMSNRPELVATVFGVALAGGVTVLLSTFSTPPELDYLINASGMTMLLYERKVARKDFEDILCQLEPAIKQGSAPLLSQKFPLLRRLVRLDPHSADGVSGCLESWQEFLLRGNSIPSPLVETIAAGVKPSDAALLFFSSGTTGLPKGILHTQRAAAIQWWRWPRVMGVDPDVRVWTANGFFWSGQLSMVLGCGLSTGGTVVLQPTFDPEEALVLMQTERVTLPCAWPHQLAKLEGARNFQDVDLSSLRYVDPRAAIARHSTVKMTGWYEPPAYGTTETFTIVAGHPNFVPTPENQHLQGPVFAGVTMKIVDPFSGAIVPRGQRGEIAVKGPTVMLGYLGIPLAETLDEEGFFRTGDSGYLDKEGNVFWEGRLSDIIKTGGANVSPREIDSVLANYPGIKLSRTVGIPHATLGEMVVGCVVAHEDVVLDEASIRDYLKERLASYKVPRRLLFFDESEIAKTGSDKVKADALIAQATQRLAQR
jgi:fatty-acyl-CoA synthase